MNARTQTRTATLAAMALTLALTASLAAAAPGVAERAKSSVPCRLVATYTMSAWLAPAAVVLSSPAAWQAWNDQMVNDGLAVAAEPLPQDVDWSKESVLVLALGEVSGLYHLEMLSARRGLNGTTVSLKVEVGQGGSSPALVMAMPKPAARRLMLDCEYAMPECRTYPEPTLATMGGAEPVAVATSWGAMKAEYR
jgi:hypothetical protein